MGILYCVMSSFIASIDLSSTDIRSYLTRLDPSCDMNTSQCAEDMVCSICHGNFILELDKVIAKYEYLFLEDIHFPE